MTRDDPLAGLDAIDWSQLEHAYGPAEDVPGLLRALRSTSTEERAEAMQTLYGNIFHQGTRYEATAFAVPFLARLALDPATIQRADLVQLLGSITVGYDEAYLPRGIDIAGQRAELDKLRRADPAERLREYDAWVEAATDEADRRRREMYRRSYDFEQEVRSAGDHLAAYDAVRAQVPALRVLLGEADPEVRAATAYLLGWFPEEASGSVAALQRLLDAETVAAVAASAVVSLGLIGDAELGESLEDRLSGADPLLRWAAAIALARLGRTDPGVVQALAAATVDPPEPAEGPWVGFLDGDVRGYASLTLATLADWVTPEAFDAVVDGLSSSTGISAFPVAAAALRLAFPAGPVEPLPSFADLTDRQRCVVRVLADLGPDTWRWGNFTEIMASWKLPRTHAECRDYAGLAAVE